MAAWETEAMQTCSLKPTMYLRYLDDIWMLWDHGMDQFHTFFDRLNNHHPAVKLTARIEETEIDFLDVTVFKGPNLEQTGSLDTKVFFKPTDTHQLLHKSSFHPKHTFSGILKSQIMRFYRICSQKEDFDKTCSVLFNALRPRGYTRRFLRQIKSETLQILQSGNTFKIPEMEPVNTPHYASACGHNHLCKTCDAVVACSEIVSNVTKEIFKIPTDLNCNSSNIIYMIACESCGKQYIGETKRSLRVRFNRHRYTIENDIPTAVSSHFNRGRCFQDDCKIIPIYQCPKLATEELTTKRRLEIEQYFIKKLKSYTPFGMNIATTKYNDSQNIQFIVPFSGLASRAASIVRSHYKELQEYLPQIFSGTLVTAFSRNKNLRDTLVSSKLR